MGFPARPGKIMAIGFKEWEVICAALGRGDQSIILRKGGIAEGREGFQFQHPEFYLFPTFFHEQAEKVRPEAAADFGSATAKVIDDRPDLRLGLFARIDFHRVLEDWEQAKALEPFHIWTESEIRKRFDGDEVPGISLALVRVYRLRSPWCFRNEKSYGGCRSWITLPSPPEEPDLEPVLDDAAHGALKDKLLAVLEGS